jgi:hypothetical protein
MTAPRDLDRQLDAFLRDGPVDLPDPSFDAVRDRIESTRQRVVIGPWRMPDMTKLVAIGLGGAAVVVALIIGSQALGPPRPGGVGAPASSSPSPKPTVSPTAWTGIPQGPFVITGDGDPVAVTVDIKAPAWSWVADLDFIAKNDDGLDSPESVGAALLAWTWPAGTSFDVYRDPCQWSTTIPETPATTPEEIAAALAAQASTDATAPVDVTVGGYTGKAVTLHTPMSFYIDEGANREEEFADCDRSVFGFYGIEGGTEPERNAQGPGQVDELWILDVDGAIVILDATYGPAAPAALIDEMRAMAESATFK